MNKIRLCFILFVLLVLSGAGVAIYYIYSTNEDNSSITTTTMSTTSSIDTTSTIITTSDVITEETTIVTTATDQITTNTKTNYTIKPTTNKPGTTKRITNQTRTTENLAPLYIHVKIRFDGSKVIGEIDEVSGGKEPYKLELSLYKNGVLQKSVNGNYDDITVNPKESAVYKVYGKIVDATGLDLESEREMRLN